MLIISIYDHDNVSCMSRNGLDAANTISPLMHDAANTIISLLLERGCCSLSATRNATLVNTYFSNHYMGITIIHMTRQSKSYCSSAKVGKAELVTNTECRSLREERLVVIIVRSPRCHTPPL